MLSKRNLFAATAVAALLTGCVEESTSDAGERENEKVMEDARSLLPTPQPNNFLTRKAVVKWMDRMDVADKTYYIYLLAETGQTIGYYVAQTRPISACTSLTPPDKERDVNGGGPNPLGAAPGLDGVYHAGECNSYFFFDAETDAYLEINGVDFFVADQPLSLDADPIRVAQ